jgi:diguanylate cyclase (GGDEF)-like protein/PAS domain S-box-containing protein
MDRSPEELSLRQLQMLRAFAEEANRHYELEPLLAASLETILRLVGSPTGWISVLHEDGTFRMGAARGLPPGLEVGEKAALRWQPCRCQRMLLSGQLRQGINILMCERLETLRAQGLGKEATGDLVTHASIPIPTGAKRPLGLINLAGSGPLTEGTLAMLDMAAQTLGIAIERCMLYARVREERRSEAEMVASLSRSLLTALTVEEVGREVLETLARGLSPDGLRFMVVDPSGEFVELRAAQGWAEELVGRFFLPLIPPESGAPARAVAARSPLLEDVGQPEGKMVPESVQRAGIRRMLTVPMLRESRPLGVLIVEYRWPAVISEDQIRFAVLVAEVAALALERALEHHANRNLIENLPLGIYRSTPEGLLLDINLGLVKLLGYSTREEVLALTAEQIYADPAARRSWQQMMEREGTVVGFEAQWRRADGSAIWVRESARVVRDAAGRPAYYEGIAEDITERKRAEADLRYLASFDPLTGALNRRRFQEELEATLALSTKAGRPGALLLFDLDNFKEINDMLGHAAGDEVLREVAGTLRRRLREGNTLGRLGGDEFAVVAYPATATQAMAVALRLLDLVRSQVQVWGSERVGLTASCGIAIFPAHGQTVEEISAAADTALYDAKEQGGDRAVVYSETLARRPSYGQPQLWRRRLEEALEEGRLTALAQPIVSLRDRGVTGWELLARIQHGEEVLTPASFLAPAERLSLISRIDAAMFRMAAALALRTGRRAHVNFSGRTLRDRDLIRSLLRIKVEGKGLPWGLIVVEVTETAAITDLASIQDSLEILLSVGCKVALDDFGIGFSSLYYLRHLPIDMLKVDASFVRKVTVDPQDRHVVAAVVELARGLGKETVAEGVEEAAVLEAVEALGVDNAQGYFLGRPVELTSVE